MTAVLSVKAETVMQRLEREKAEWIQEAKDYLLHLQVVEEGDDLGWVEELHASSIGLEGILYTPKEAVDEELSYWGD